MKRFFPITLISALIAGCSNVAPIDDPSNDSDNESLSSEFVLVKANGKSVSIESTKGDEDNQSFLTASFSYDFWIGRHEVTCKEFKSLLKKSDCDNDSLPATNVSYNDAVLYANAKSKNEGHDTAYTYTSIETDNEGHCTALNNLVFLPEVKAYRLPTEAEWILAAQQGWNTENSWTSENAESNHHPVCSRGKNDLEICDMEGNVMEYVNDWLGYSDESSIQNFAGAKEGGALKERIIKGGSYRSPAAAINLYSRKDVYTVTSATMADYLGFRLAFGKIPDAKFLSGGNKEADANITIISNAGTVRQLTGSFRTKLAFRNDYTQNLVYIDYSEMSLVSTEIQDTLNVFHPAISPDGNHVAFCTSIEGIKQHSDIYVRDLNKAGTNLIKLDVESAAIPRWKVLDSGDTVIVYVSSAQSNKSDATFKGESTWMVPFANGSFGTPQKLFDGAYHGGVDNNLKFAVSGSPLLRARTGKTDTIWYNGEQACNASLAKDGSRRTLFLDFGGSTGQKFVGKKYGTHEQLLIADSNGVLIQGVPSPKGYSFDHTEWFTDKYVIATLSTAEGFHEKIVLLNTSDSSITELVSGKEIWHPDIWTTPYAYRSTKVDMDSAAIYWNDDSDPLLSAKMNVFWANSDSLQIIALGSSRVSMGFKPTEITNGKAFNFAAIPSDMDVSMYLAENYIFPHAKKLEVLVVALDLDLWSDKPGANVKRNLLSFPGYQYDINHNFWKDGGADEIIQISRDIMASKEFLQIIQSIQGWVCVTEINSWATDGFNPNMIANDSSWSSSDKTYRKALQEFESLIKMSQERGVLVVGVIFPQSPLYKETGSFGRHGMKRSTAKAIIKEIAELESTYSNFIFMDENKMGDHDYADSLAYDYDHLNYLGAHKITARIDSAITAYKSRNNP